MSVLVAVTLGLATLGQPRVTPTDASGDRYTLDASETTSSLRAGKKGAFVLHIKAATGAKISADAPLTVSLSSSGVVLAKSELGAKDATKKKFVSPTFRVSFKAKDPGETSIAVKASFFVCDDKICERKLAKLSVPITVRP